MHAYLLTWLQDAGYKTGLIGERIRTHGYAQPGMEHGCGCMRDGPQRWVHAHAWEGTNALSWCLVARGHRNGAGMRVRLQVRLLPPAWRSASSGCIKESWHGASGGEGLAVRYGSGKAMVPCVPVLVLEHAESRIFSTRL